MLENQAWIRLSIFLALFVLFTSLEQLLPKRRQRDKKSKRWFTNLCLLLIDSITLRLLALLLPLLAVGAALDANAKDWGLFNYLDWSLWIEVALSLLILDFVIWFQHLISHKIPLLWRLHQVHHADQEMDVTTGIRFHPIEIALSMILKVGAIYLLGPLALAVIAYEALLNGMALFNHTNLRLPKSIEAVMRWVVVTPDMHRVHHSVHRHEHDSNYGNTLSLWDRVFRTYVSEPGTSHERMELGLRWRDEKPRMLLWSLLLPFK